MHKQLVYLYVEDDLLSQQIMKTIMVKGMGVINTLTIFQDSNNFLERARAVAPKPDVILLDIHVKPYDGFAMLRMLRTAPEFTDCRIVALTASVMNEEVDKLRSSGFNGAIAKPLSVLTFPGLMKRIAQGEAVWHIV